VVGLFLRILKPFFIFRFNFIVLVSFHPTLRSLVLIWNEVPHVIRDSFEANRLGKPFLEL
jgi:hypothetical protein